jgi:adenylate kinase family enzyme
MTRVMVIGNAGGGKSTMCRALSAAHALPYHAIDKIQWKPNWIPTPEPDFTNAHEALLSQ